MKKQFMPVIIAAVLAVSSCSDWTETESLDLLPATPEQQDPAGYQRYLAALREYKNTDHPVVIVTVPGTSAAPTRQNQHFTSMADSVDYICVSDAGGLNPVLVDEISTVRSNKGTRFLSVVDYSTIQEAWIELDGRLPDEVIANSDPELFAAYCKEQTELQLSWCDLYGFDGIEISYLGRRNTTFEAAGQKAFMDCILAWRQNHPGKQMFFRGYAHNLLDEYLVKDSSILDDCQYIIILADTAYTSSSLTLAIRQVQIILTNAPTDRYVIEVAIAPIETGVQTGATPQVAAAWALEEETRFTKLGIAIDNAQDDYFTKSPIYKDIREAIGILDPSNNTDEDDEQNDE